MQSFFKRLDSIAGINAENPAAKWLERISFIFLILMTLAAPHSIAATQSAWLLGMFLWVIRLFLTPRPKLARTPLDAVLWAFFGWSVLSSIFSYAPDISLDKLRNPALFLIFYFIVNLVRTKRAALFLISALIFSTVAVALWAPVERLIGRGVEISGVRPESPLAKAVLLDGDTLLEAGKMKLREPEDLVRALEENERVELIVYRPDFNFAVELRRADLLPGGSALEKLGIDNWRRSRNWRSAGFYSHFTNFAEMLQLVGSLALGLLITLISFKFRKDGFRAADQKSETLGTNPKSQISNRNVLLLALSVAAIGVALLLTATRASQAAFLISAFLMVFILGNRRLIWAAALVLVPAALIAVFIWQQSRPEGVLAATDGSTQYRLMMYRDGLRLWTDSARNFTLGVGMDSIKRYWLEWNLFDKGWQPMGHFHSTPLQLAVERGFPALLLWLWLLWSYARLLWRKLRTAQTSIVEKGILLGSLGGLAGFFASGLVHYNYGAAVVAMIFFIIMGLSVKLVVSCERGGSGEW